MKPPSETENFDSGFKKSILLLGELGVYRPDSQPQRLRHSTHAMNLDDSYLFTISIMILVYFVLCAIRENLKFSLRTVTM